MLTLALDGCKRERELVYYFSPGHLRRERTLRGCVDRAKCVRILRSYQYRDVYCMHDAHPREMTQAVLCLHIDHI